MVTGGESTIFKMELILNMTGAVSEAECLRLAEGDNIHFSMTYFQTCFEWSLLNYYWTFFQNLFLKMEIRTVKQG